MDYGGVAKRRVRVSIIAQGAKFLTTQIQYFFHKNTTTTKCFKMSKCSTNDIVLPGFYENIRYVEHKQFTRFERTITRK